MSWRHMEAYPRAKKCKRPSSGAFYRGCDIGCKLGTDFCFLSLVLDDCRRVGSGNLQGMNS